MLIRKESEKDLPAVHSLNLAAFESAVEAELVDVLRKQAHPLVSLVAEAEGTVVGHILFSPVTLSGYAHLKIMGLGPMAVLPAMQRQGIGSALVDAGLEACNKLGFGAVVVLGHPAYYPRFGFVPSTHYHIKCEYDVPDEVFMVLTLQPNYLQGVSGTIHYHEAFNQV